MHFTALIASVSINAIREEATAILREVEKPSHVAIRPRPTHASLVLYSVGFGPLLPRSW